MRKISSLFLATVLLIASCQKSSTPADTEEVGAATAITQRACGANEVLEAQMAADPSLRQRMNAIEDFTKKAIASGVTARLVNGVIEIPVVVHVVYRTAAENISATQVQSQIDVLNEDFNNTNPDRGLVPLEFRDEQTSVGVRFVLDRIIRKATTKRSWGTNDAVKRASSGGSNPVDPATYLNIWVCNLGQGLLGYAQFPGGSAATDGVVCLYSAFGRTGTLMSTYDKGRTTTHEVGHWMNLRHIWGDATCGSDGVGDTPTHNTANYGCPSAGHKSTCAGAPTEMTMNYMDYTDDACMYMFSNGQRDRMLAVFAAGGPRASMGQ